MTNAPAAGTGLLRAGAAFFDRPTVRVARDLLGMHLVRSLEGTVLRARIVETEAYHGPRDRASHASRGMTERTKIMFGPPGCVYVYLIYGMYHCLNFVTMPEGFPAAVLIRAVDLPGGNGPGRTCRLMHIDRSLNGLAPGNDRLWIELDGALAKRGRIAAGTRIGVDYAGPWKDKLWRFTLTG
jgi:DNA-3-methyladenine glycosylase